MNQFTFHVPGLALMSIATGSQILPTFHSPSMRPAYVHSGVYAILPERMIGETTWYLVLTSWPGCVTGEALKSWADEFDREVDQEAHSLERLEEAAEMVF